MDLIPIAGSGRIRGYGWEENPVNRQLFKGRMDARAQRRERAGVLLLEFTDGARWYYFDVPCLVYEGFLLAASKGSYFHKFIRGRFDEKPAAEVEPEERA